MYSSDILNIHKEKIMKDSYTNHRRKIEKVTEKLDKLKEELRELEDLEIKRGYYMDCLSNCYDMFSGDYNIEEVSLDGVSDYIYGDGIFLDSFTTSED